MHIYIVVLSSCCVFQQFKDHGEGWRAVYISVPPAGVISSLNDRDALSFEECEYALHAFDLKGNMMDSFTVLMEKFFPCLSLCLFLPLFHPLP